MRLETRFFLLLRAACFFPILLAVGCQPERDVQQINAAGAVEPPTPPAPPTAPPVPETSQPQAAVNVPTKSIATFFI